MSRFTTSKAVFSSPASSNRPYTPPSGSIGSSSSSPHGTPKLSRSTVPGATYAPPGLPSTAQSLVAAPSTDYTHLAPSLLHALRSSFLYLDKDSDGVISPTDLATTLTSLALPPHTAPYFTAIGTHNPNLASYLTHLSSFLTELSPEEEMMLAFEAFDDGDEGSVDVAELKEAVMNTGDGGERLGEGEVERVVRGFTRRRGLRGGVGGGGDRFGYRDWIGLVCGKGEEGED